MIISNIKQMRLRLRAIELSEKSMSEQTICNGFVWEDTEEGHLFWAVINNERGLREALRLVISTKRLKQISCTTVYANDRE